MVKKLLLTACFLALFFSSPGYSSENRQNLIQEIEDTFAEDILSSNKVSKKRKFYLKYPHKFEAGPAKLFLFHSNPELTLKTILGDENYLKINKQQSSELIEALKNTFRRYAYEWLNSNLNTSLILKKISLIDKKSAILVVERNLKIVPDLDLKLFIKKTNNGWKVYDFGFWEFRYTKMKRGLYLRYMKKNDIEGLIKYLEGKNYKFFKKINNFIAITP